MQFKKVLPYKLKRLVPMLGLAGASLFMTGCEKEESIPMRDVELKFTVDDFSTIAYSKNGELFISDVAKHYVNDKSVRTIYLVPDGRWYTFVEISVRTLRKNALEPLFEYSNKFKGKGDFDFFVGTSSREDSLWYLSKGWTINKYR